MNSVEKQGLAVRKKPPTPDAEGTECSRAGGNGGLGPEPGAAGKNMECPHGWSGGVCVAHCGAVPKTKKKCCDN